MHRIAAVLKVLTQLNKSSINNFIRHECQNGIRGGCFFILFDGYVKAMLQLRDIMMKSEDLKASATVFSIIETAKENNLDPYEYLKYVFTKAPNMENSESIDILLPWNAPDCCRSKFTHSAEQIRFY